MCDVQVGHQLIVARLHCRRNVQSPFQNLPESISQRTDEEDLTGRAAAEGFSPTSPRAHWIRAEDVY